MASGSTDTSQLWSIGAGPVTGGRAPRSAGSVGLLGTRDSCGCPILRERHDSPRFLRSPVESALLLTLPPDRYRGAPLMSHCRKCCLSRAEPPLTSPGNELQTIPVYRSLSGTVKAARSAPCRESCLLQKTRGGVLIRGHIGNCGYPFVDLTDARQQPPSQYAGRVTSRPRRDRAFCA